MRFKEEQVRKNKKKQKQIDHKKDVTPNHSKRFAQAQKEYLHFDPTYFKKLEDQE